MFTRSLSLSRCKFVGLSAGQRDLTSMKGPLPLQGGWLSVSKRGLPPVRGALPSDKEGPPFVDHRDICRSEGAICWSDQPSVGRKYFLGKRSPPSFNTTGPSVGHMTIVRSEGPPYIRGGSLSDKGGPPSSRGPSVGQIIPPPVKKYFLGQRLPPSFNTRRPLSVIGPSVYQRGP